MEWKVNDFILFLKSRNKLEHRWVLCPEAVWGSRPAESLDSLKPPSHQDLQKFKAHSKPSFTTFISQHTLKTKKIYPCEGQAMPIFHLKFIRNWKCNLKKKNEDFCPNTEDILWFVIFNAFLDNLNCFSSLVWAALVKKYFLIYFVYRFKKRCTESTMTKLLYILQELNFRKTFTYVRRKELDSEFPLKLA